MTRQIIVNSGIREKRAAVLFNNTLDDMFFERDTYEQIAGNIYRGRVKDVLPGMQAAFIDIGVNKNAFLYVSDLYPLLSEPGRYFVLLPFEKRISISRKINDEEDRQKLRELAQELTGGQIGVIIRTNALGRKMEELQFDYEYLINLWEEVENRYKKKKAPFMLYQNVGLIRQLVRDYLSADIDKLVIDSGEDYAEIIQLLDKIAPHLKKKISLYERESPIFSNYGIEKEFLKILKRKVWLESGGYIIFDKTEALMAIDVNTGKYTGKKNLQDTVFKTNIEAAREIALQLRLRDIGGIIIIDFIDMIRKQDQQKVLQTLEEELTRDRTKTTLIGLTGLGLVEMTRKKVREGFSELIQKECPYCNGTGMVMSESTMALKIIREINELAVREHFTAILLELHPLVAAVLIGVGGDKLDELEKELDLDIYIRGNDELHIEDYHIIKKGSKEELARLAFPVEEDKVYKLRVEEKQINNPEDGIARIKGYIIIIKQGGYLVGEEIEVKIVEVSRTFARAIKI